jgi:hypothetical protein
VIHGGSASTGRASDVTADELPTEPSRDRISAYCESDPEREFDVVVAVFEHDCRSVADLFTDESALEDVPRVAWSQTQNRLRTGRHPTDLTLADDCIRFRRAPSIPLLPHVRKSVFVG